MNWKLKSLGMGVASLPYAGPWFHYLMQRFATGSLPRSREKLQQCGVTAGRHVKTFRDFGAVTLDHAVFFEFGAGYDLALPLLYHGLGVKRQIIVDEQALARHRWVRDVIDRWDDFAPEDAVGCPEPLPSGSLTEALARGYGIEYRAPVDARRTGLPDASVDCVTTTSTLEHIPKRDLPAIFAECLRILKPGGVVSMLIDYADHYAYSDGKISPYNFLRFSDREWARHSRPVFYQNRLRHSDMLRLFQEAGFEIAADRHHGGRDIELEQLRRLPLAAPFQGYEFTDLSIYWAHVAARKSSGTSKAARE